MRKTLLAVAALAVPLGAAPALAQRHNSGIVECTQWRHGVCVGSHKPTRDAARGGGFAVGYDFGPNRAYVDPGALPPPVVSRYHLGPGFRYVNEGGRVYVVNPHSYRVVRVIQVR